MRNEEYDFTSAVGTTPTVGTTAVGTSSTVGGSTVIKRLKYINSLMHLKREGERVRWIKGDVRGGRERVI